MANPRKFSEKIALHNKKQAEETAAFEAVLREVSATTHGVLNKQPCQLLQQQHLGQPSDALCHGGSLPNVKLASNNYKSINIQEALHEMKQTESGRQTLFDRMHRCQPLHEQVHTREQFDMKRDCSPYSLTYLSPPPDTSWRRAHSDSAIHSSTLAAPSQQTFSSPLNSSPTPNGIIFDMTPVSPVYQLLSANEIPQMIQSQSCCCDVPHSISNNARPSLEQDSGIDTNTGSLPNLSDLQFGVGGSSDDVLGTAGYHSIGPMRVSSSQGSPGSRHRRARAGPKPLFLPSSPNVAHYQGGTSVPASLMQYRGSSVSDCGTPSPSPVSPSLSLNSYSPPSPGFFSDVLYIQQQQQQQQQQHPQQQQHCLLQQQFEDISVTPTGSLEGQHNVNYYCGVQSQPRHSPYYIPTNAMFHFAVSDCASHSPLLQSSPVAAHGTAASYFNSNLPASNTGHGCFSSSNMQQSTSATGQLSYNISRASPITAAMPLLQHTARIPDIILTGADELLFGQQLPDHYERDMPFHSASVLSNNSEMMSNVDDLLCLDDALGVGLNPLELDELQMLTDVNMLTDPATEDSFRFDQL